MKVDIDEAAVQRLRELPEVQAELERRVLRGVQHAKSECPVDTGRAQTSIRGQRVEDGNWRIVGGGTGGVDYFEYIEYGTRDTEAHHPILKSLDALRGA